MVKLRDEWSIFKIHYGIAGLFARSTLLPLVVLIYPLVVLVYALAVLVYALIVLVCSLVCLLVALVVHS